jgi:hypothetical protein
VWRERLDTTNLRSLLHDTPNDFGAESVPQIRPALLIERRSGTVLIPAAVIQTSIPAFTHSGIGMVRMWPPLPTRSAMTQCSSLLYVFIRVVQSTPRGGDRNPTELPTWIVSLTAKGRTVCRQQQALALFGTEAIANGRSQPFCTLYPANSGGQVCAQQAAISSLPPLRPAVHQRPNLAVSSGCIPSLDR